MALVDDLPMELKPKEMSKSIRSKFNVTSITRYGNNGGRLITFAPVMGHSEENKDFWSHTPSGKIELHVTNESAIFELGEYYVDFIKADE